MIQLTDFTNKQQEVIAEFIHAYQTDTLIKSEGEALLKVFQDHKVVLSDSNSDLSIDDYLKLILLNIDLDTIDEIMKKYYKGEL